MDRAGKTALPDREVIVTIRHAGEWDQRRHGPAFLRPIIDGERRRLAAAAAKTPSPSGPPTG